MKGRFLLGFLGILLSLVGCSSNSDPTAQSASDQISIATKPQETFANPLVSPVRKPVPARPVPGLVQSTNAKTRASAIATGRRDPFASLPSATPMVVVAARPAPKPAIAPLPATPVAVPGQLPTIPLPPLATAPLPNSPLPSVNIPVAPPSRTALAESIEVTGVVQVAGKWSVIVKEPTASSSRHVGVGEYLENGKVLVKKIVAPQSSDPVVVLQQGGVEIRKSLV